MEGWVGLEGWPIVDILPTQWSHVNHRSGTDQGKQPAKDRLSHAANQNETKCSGKTSRDVKMRKQCRKIMQLLTATCITTHKHKHSHTQNMLPWSDWPGIYRPEQTEVEWKTHHHHNRLQAHNTCNMWTIIIIIIIIIIMNHAEIKVTLSH